MLRMSQERESVRMKNQSKAENSMMLSSNITPRASAEKIDELFGRRLTRSSWHDMVAATIAPAFNPCSLETSKSASIAFSFELKTSGEHQIGSHYHAKHKCIQEV